MILLDIIHYARRSEHRWKGAWVSFCHSIFILGIGLLLWMSWDFQFHDKTGIVGWLSVNQYPKHQEFIAYIGSFLFVFLGVTCGWFIWCGSTAIYCRFRRTSIKQGLHRTTLIFTGYVLTIIPIMSGHWNISGLLLLPLVSVLLLGSALWFWPISPTKSQNENKVNRLHNQSLQYSMQDIYRWTRLSSRWRIAVIWILLPLILYFYLYDVSKIHSPPDLYHEGEMLAPLNTFLRGGIPFRDIYIQHGLFHNVGKGWLSALIDTPSLMSLRLTKKLIAPLGYLALYVLGMLVFRSWLTAVILVLIMSSQNLFVSDRYTFGLLALASFVHALNVHSRFQTLSDRDRQSIHWLNYWFLVSGGFTTLAFFYSTDVGIYTFTTCAIFFCIKGITYLWKRQPQVLGQVFSYLTGLLLVLAPFLLYFGFHGALYDLIKNIYVQSIYQIPIWGLAYPPLLPSLLDISSIYTVREFVLSETFRWYLPIIVYLFTAGVLVFRAMHGNLWDSPINTVLLIVLLAGVTFFRTALGRSDTGHLWHCSSFYWILILIALECFVLFFVKKIKQTENIIQKMKFVWFPVILISVLGSYIHFVHRPLESFQERAQRAMKREYTYLRFQVFQDRLGNVKIDTDQRKHFELVLKYIRQNTRIDEPIFDFSNQGAYYFLLDRPSVTRFHQIVYAATPAMQQEVIKSLVQNNIRLVIYSTGSWYDKIDGISTGKRLPIIERYIKTHFFKVVEINDTVIMIRDI
jgi:hypothetical protein